MYALYLYTVYTAPPACSEITIEHKLVYTAKHGHQIKWQSF